MLIVDIETQSDVDLKERGGFVYSEACKLICASWTADGENYSVWLPQLTHVRPDLAELHLPGVTIHLGPVPPIPTDDVWWGHNSFGFDELVWERLYPDHKPKKWMDSMCLAAAAGLPAGLQQIATRLWGEGKWQEGSQALKRASRSMSPVPAPQQLLIARYNVQDVRLQWQVVQELQESYHPTRTEMRVLSIHREINRRGIKIDHPLVTRIRQLVEESVGWAIAEIHRVTNGALSGIKALRSKTVMIKWIKQQIPDIKLPTMTNDKGIVRESLRRELIDRWIEERSEELETEDGEDSDDAPENLPLVMNVLKLRQAAMRITGGKLKSAGDAISRDGIARGLFAYFGAHTGRWAGRRIQLHNLPRPKPGASYFFWVLMGAPSAQYEQVLTMLGRWDAGELAAAEPEDRDAVYLKWAQSITFIELMFLLSKWNEMVDELSKDESKADEWAKVWNVSVKELVGLVRLTPDDIASAMIRGIFIPLHELLAADLSSIEARVLAWLAGEKWLLDAFWQGLDPYIEFAYKVTGVRYTKKDPARQLWKAIQLGSGYQLGVRKLAVYLAASGIDLADYGVSPEFAIDAYRDNHPAIAGYVAGEFEGKKYRKGGLWNALEAAAIAAIKNGVSVETHGLRFEYRRGHLYLRLPSGRELCYRNAGIEDRPWFGKFKPTVRYESARFKTVWMYGGKWTENVVQAISRDIMAEMLVMCEDAGLNPVLHVHDEVVCDAPEERIAEFRAIMTHIPDWAAGLPVDAEGSALPRYSKSPPPGKKDEEWKCNRPAG